MNTIGNDIIQHIFTFLNTDNLKIYRELCQIINKIISPIYFNSVAMDIGKISNIDAQKFMNFINKYKLYINATNVRGVKQLKNYVNLCNNNPMFKSITLSFYFETITWLPEELQSLKLPQNFNSEIECGVLPEGLKQIEFGRYFQFIDIDALPKSLICLTFNNLHGPRFKPYDKPINFRIKLCKYYQDQLLNIYCSQIEHLEFSEGFHHNLNETNLPKALKTLILPKTYSGKIILEKFKKTSYDKSSDIYEKID
jgi:hypothetical protein